MIGGPWWWWGGYPYYPYPYAYPPYPPTVIEEGPQTYIQQSPPSQVYWYYCASAKGYYPAVAECPEEWIKVPPVPGGSE